MKLLIRSLIPHPDGVSFWVPLTKGKFARIDKEDAERVGEHNWCAVGKGRKANIVYYARTKPRGQKAIEMQRFIASKWANLDGLEVDHLNFDTLDNRTDNLQVSSQARNIYRTRARVESGECAGGTWPKIRLKAEPQPVFTEPLPPPRVVIRRSAFNRRILDRLEAAIARNSQAPSPLSNFGAGGAR